MIDDDKRLAAEAAVGEIKDNMLVGLGTGTTAAYVIDLIAARVTQGLKIRTVATSLASERLARSKGIAVLDFAHVAEVDLTIDGADEIDSECRAIKGAGGAMLREKIVASASKRMIVIADGTKRVERLGRGSLPVEVLPFARGFADARLRSLGAEPVWRMRGEQRYCTDQGNEIADCRFPQEWEAGTVASALDAMPGVMGHGLFLAQVVAAYIAQNGIVTKLERLV